MKTTGLVNRPFRGHRLGDYETIHSPHKTQWTPSFGDTVREKPGKREGQLASTQRNDPAQATGWLLNIQQVYVRAVRRAQELCVKVEVAVLGSPSLVYDPHNTVSVDVK